MASKTVDLIGPDGGFYHGPEEIVEAALNQGYRLPTQEDYRRETIREAADTPTGMIAASTGSAADMLTFGAFGKALENFAPEKKEILDIAQGENPISSGVGSAAGLGTSLVAGGPIFSAIGTAGKATGAAVGSRVASVAGNAAGKVAEQVARFGTEGALAASPVALTELIGGEPEEAAEALLAGGVLGAGVGAPLSLTGMMISRAGREAVSAAQKAGTAVRGAVDDVVYGARDKLASGVEGIANRMPSELAGDVTELAAGAVPRTVEEALISKLDDFEQDRYEKMLGINKSMTKKLNKTNPEGVDNLISWAKSKGIFKKDFDPQSELIDAQSKLEEIGPEIRGILSNIDDTKRSFVDTTSLLSKIKSVGRTINEYDPSGMDAKIYENTVETLMPKLVDAKGNPRLVKLTTLQDMKIGLGKYGYGDKLNLKPGKEIVQSIWHAVDDTLEESLEWAEKSFPDVAQKWLGFKDDYYGYKRLEVVLQDAQAQGGNKMVSLTDMLSSVAGGTVGGIPGAVIGYGASSYLRKNGLYYTAKAAEGLRKAIEWQNGAIDGAIDRFLNAAPGAVRKGGQTAESTLRQMAEKIRGQRPVRPEAAGVSANATREQAARDVIDRIATISVNAEDMLDRLHAFTADTKGLSPQVGDALQQRMTTTLSYLQAEAPKSKSPDSPFAPVAPTYEPGQVWSFDRKLRAALTPYEMLNDLERGTLDPETVKTVQTLYPKMYEKIQISLLDKAALQKGKRYSYRQRAAIALILGTTDPTFSPDFIRRAQEQYRKATANENLNGPTPGANIALPGAQPTQVERIAAR